MVTLYRNSDFSVDLDKQNAYWNVLSGLGVLAHAIAKLSNISRFGAASANLLSNSALACFCAFFVVPIASLLVAAVSGLMVFKIKWVVWCGMV
jgi:hypothetical protein